MGAGGMLSMLETAAPRLGLPRYSFEEDINLQKHPQDGRRRGG
jgi:hypothetical protein